MRPRQPLRFLRHNLGRAATHHSPQAFVKAPQNLFFSVMSVTGLVQYTCLKLYVIPLL